MIQFLVTSTNQVYITIMGGDGSLAQTIKELRTNKVINECINKFVFCLLPYGTGNDTG
jgi:diacylglycerol kinase family enzyme